MIRVALDGYEKPVLENPGINAVAGREQSTNDYMGRRYRRDQPMDSHRACVRHIRR
jgi:hypothetical protein